MGIKRVSRNQPLVTQSAVSVFDATQITLASGPSNLALEYNETVPAIGHVSFVDGTITRFADKAIIDVRVFVYQDATFSVDFVGAIPTDGNIVQVQATSRDGDGAEDPYADVSISVQGPTQIRFNRANEIDEISVLDLQVTIDGHEEFFPVSSGSTVANTATMNYQDIGNTRIQWGTQASDGVVTLPQPFANTAYSVTTANIFENALRSSQVVASSKTTTQFTIRAFSSNAGSATGCDWMAIGLKP